MSFEHEKMKTLNLIELGFQKTKGARNENVFVAEANLMAVKKGRGEETTKENSQHKKMKEMAREKGKWKSQRWLGMQDFSIFAGQMPYFVIVNLSTKKVDITVGQLVDMFPTIRWDLWRRLSAHYIKALHKKHVHLVEAEFDSCAPLVEVICHGIPLKGILVDGGVGMNVMIVSTMETLGLQCDR